jgi:hypothetical protein
MKTLTSNSQPFIRLTNDMEVRLFMLHFLPEKPITCTQVGFELRVTWDELDIEAARWIQKIMKATFTEMQQSKLN